MEHVSTNEQACVLLIRRLVNSLMTSLKYLSFIKCNQPAENFK